MNLGKQKDNISYFSAGFIVGIVIVAFFAYMAQGTYHYFSYGEGLGRLKSIGRKFKKEFKEPPGGHTPSTVPIIMDDSN